ncbi:hypothetical protein EDB84DRAFT_51763 [Lactarius hengduanensis]|nr:hypothetical protein EDB84DRAFT_51763 [Lactarius hengduanensis]
MSQALATHPPIPLPISNASLAPLSSHTRKKPRTILRNNWKHAILLLPFSPCFRPLSLIPSRTAGDDRLKTWFVPTINVLDAFSGTLSKVSLWYYRLPKKVSLASVSSSCYRCCRKPRYPRRHLRTHRRFLRLARDLYRGPANSSYDEKNGNHS